MLYDECFTGSYIQLSNTPLQPAKIIKDIIELLNSKQIQVAGARLKWKTKTLILVIISLK